MFALLFAAPFALVEGLNQFAVVKNAFLFTMFSTSPTKNDTPGNASPVDGLFLAFNHFCCFQEVLK